MTDTPDILKKIVDRKKTEVKERSSRVPLSRLKQLATDSSPIRGFVSAIQKKLEAKKPAIIAEIKKASPSKGVLRENFTPRDIAKSYTNAGAACLSVLTDIDYFQGSNEYLIKAREACDLPVIRKDFIIDECQVYEARVIGADCVLLIAATLDLAKLQELSDLAISLGMDVLVEVHNQSELEKTLRLDLPLLGINNRDLHTFETKLNTSIELRKLIPDDKIVVTESGILELSDVKLMQDNQINTFLVGEAFMRAPDPGVKLRELFGEI